MGNLLGSPIVDKETHSGTTACKLDYGVSSMQGWRIHMEDAHITQEYLYAEEEASAPPPVQSEQQDDEKAGGVVNAAPTMPQMNGGKRKRNFDRIPIAGHSLFAVFDGHGGTFAAQYSGLNLCRVLSRQRKFVQYAKFLKENEGKVENMNDTEEAEYNRGGLELLEGSLRDAFVELDREIMREMQGYGNEDSNTPYGDVDEGQNSSDGISSAAADKEQSQGDKDAGSGGGNDGDGSNMVEEVSGDNTKPSAADPQKPQPTEDEDSGTTAVVVLVTPKWIVCANAGDSRAVYSKGGHRAVPLSYDHKPDDEDEERRIKDAGGYVSGGRVEGDLAVSRGLGDFRFKDVDTVFAGIGGRRSLDALNLDDPAKFLAEGDDVVMMNPDDQKVSPVPDVIVQNRNKDQDEFIVVACDGIWDVQTNHECVTMVADMFDEGESNLGLVCEEVLDICLKRGSKDNMTALVIKLEAQKVGEGGGVAARRELRDAARAEEEERAEQKQMKNDELRQREEFFMGNS